MTESGGLIEWLPWMLLVMLLCVLLLCFLALAWHIRQMKSMLALPPTSPSPQLMQHTVTPTPRPVVHVMHTAGDPVSSSSDWEMPSPNGNHTRMVRVRKKDRTRSWSRENDMGQGGQGMNLDDLEFTPPFHRRSSILTE